MCGSDGGGGDERRSTIMNISGCDAAQKRTQYIYPNFFITVTRCMMTLVWKPLEAPTVDQVRETGDEYWREHLRLKSETAIISWSRQLQQEVYITAPHSLNSYTRT